MGSKIKETIKLNIDVLQQVASVIDSSSDDIYKKGTQISDFGVGRHIRHVLDYYFAIKNGYQQSLINYNHRNRDSLIEQDKTIANKAVIEISNWIKTLEHDKPMNVINEISFHETQEIILETSLQRELYYLMEHAIHHLAYISLLMKANGVSVKNDIGLAPATRSYQRVAK